MKMALSVSSGKKRKPAAFLESAALERLPVEPALLRKAARFADPKNLKLAVLVVAGGAALLSLVGKLGHERIYRAAVAREMRRQLEPLNEKLDRLEAQNEELLQQNEELRAQLARS